MSLTPRLRPLCRPIHTGIFQSPEYRKLPEDGSARLLYFCLLIHPHGGTFHLPGLYNVGREALREVISLSKKAFTKALADLIDEHIIRSDEDHRLFWVPSALRLVGPPQNPNVVKGYARSLAQLNPSPLVKLAIQSYLTFLAPFGSSFLEPFAKAFETLSEANTRAQVDPSERADCFGVYSDRDKDTNENHHHNTTCVLECQLVLDFAAECGWATVSVDRVKSWLTTVPGLSKQDFIVRATEVRHRQNVKDPLAYLFALLRKQVAQQSTNDCLNEPLSDVPDGMEVTFG